MKVNPILVLSLLSIFFIFFIPLYDTDFGWHLKYGEYVLKNGEAMKDNLLTYYLPDYRWANSYTFYDILVTLIYKTGGFNALSLAYSLVMCFAFFILTRIFPKNIFVAYLVFLGSTFSAWYVFSLGFRAQIFTFVFVLLTVYILEKVHSNKKWMAFLPMLFAIWANTHGGFVLGLAVMGFYFLQKMFHKHWETSYWVAAGIFFSSVAALINPYVLGVYREALHHAKYPLGGLIAEWVPPDILTQFIIGILGIMVPILLLIKNKNVFLACSIVFFAVLSLVAKRNVPLFSLFVLTGVVQLTLHYFEKYKTKFHTEAVIICVISVIGIMALSIQLPKTLAVNKDYCPQNILLKLPCGAVEYVKQHNIGGRNVYTAYEWGGYLEWQLPNYKYFVDGRMPAWENSENKSPYTTYLEIIQAQPGYDEKLEKYGTDWLLIGAGTFLDIELMSKDTVWKEVYRDNVAVIYTKKS